MLELAERVRKACDSESEIRLVPYEEAYEAGFEDMRRRIPDTTKIGDLLGWRPTRTLDEILGGRDRVPESARGARPERVSAGRRADRAEGALA